LFLVGVLVIVIVRYRSEGLLPPKRELIWSAALEDDDA
jgi:branched-chain amino acid transport system permease protein